VEKPVVLLADDNEATCTLILALLRSDFVVEIVNDGHAAIERLKSRHYAAILLDLIMPGVDGYAVLDHLAADRPDLLERVLVVTASLSPREMERVREYPVCGIVAKPFEVDVLQHAVRQCAGVTGERSVRVPLFSSGMILLLADLLRRV
jgi:CheY-like chemotaxis protein